MKKFIIALIFLVSCGGDLSIVRKTSVEEKWFLPYVDGMNGVENIAFDNDFMYVTGLDGVLYKIESSDNPYRGKIVLKKKIGVMCLGLVAADNGFLYVGVQEDADSFPKIIRLNKDFEGAVPLTDGIEGLNGLEIDRNGRLYYSWSNMSFISPKGILYRADVNNVESFKNPEIIIDDAGLLNGFALTPDEGSIYFTETTGSLHSIDLDSKKRSIVYTPSGFFQILDDVCVDDAGTVWLACNSKSLIIAIKQDSTVTAYQTGDLRVPSSLAFSESEKFNKKFLYITEFGLKPRSLTMNGRGVWILPLE